MGRGVQQFSSNNSFPSPSNLQASPVEKPIFSKDGSEALLIYIICCDESHLGFLTYEYEVLQP